MTDLPQAPARPARADRSGPHRCRPGGGALARAARERRSGRGADRRLVRRRRARPIVVAAAVREAPRDCRSCPVSRLGDAAHRRVDLILFLSLVSGRNPQYLIEEHVRAVPFLQQPPGAHPFDRLHPDRRRPGHERRGRESDAAAAGGQAGAGRRPRPRGPSDRDAGDLPRRRERGGASRSGGGHRRMPRRSRRSGVPLFVGGGIRTPADGRRGTGGRGGFRGDRDRARAGGRTHRSRHSLPRCGSGRA